MLRACSEVEVTYFWVTVKVTAAGQGERVVTVVPLPAMGKPTDYTTFPAIALLALRRKPLLLTLGTNT